FSLDLASSQAQMLIRELMTSGKGGFAPFAAEFMQTARDVLNERFRSPIVKAMIAPWLAHAGQTLDSANSGFSVSLLLATFIAAGMPLLRGGSEMLIKALVQLVTDHGGDIAGGSHPCGAWPRRWRPRERRRHLHRWSSRHRLCQRRPALSQAPGRRRRSACAHRAGETLSLRTRLRPDSTCVVRSAALAG